MLNLQMKPYRNSGFNNWPTQRRSCYSTRSGSRRRSTRIRNPSVPRAPLKPKLSKDYSAQMNTLGFVRCVLALVCLIVGLLGFVLKPYWFFVPIMAIAGVCYLISAGLSLLAVKFMNRRLMILNAMWSLICASIVFCVSIGMVTYGMYCNVGSHCDCVEKVRVITAEMMKDKQKLKLHDRTYREPEKAIVNVCFVNWSAVPLDIFNLFLSNLMFIMNLVVFALSLKLTQIISKRLLAQKNRYSFPLPEAVDATIKKRRKAPAGTKKRQVSTRVNAGVNNTETSSRRQLSLPVDPSISTGNPLRSRSLGAHAENSFYTERNLEHYYEDPSSIRKISPDSANSSMYEPMELDDCTPEEQHYYQDEVWTATPPPLPSRYYERRRTWFNEILGDKSATEVLMDPYDPNRESDL